MELQVSVLIITYNHEKYISRAIESVLAQNVNFSYQIVLSDDCSTDKTAEIVLNYADKFSEKFNVQIRKKNVGPSKNAIDNYLRCHGKYIAILEGDDYWIDENKLQKQYDFMEAHPDVAFCYTNAYSFIDGNEAQTEIMIKKSPSQNIFDLDYYLNNGCFLTPTLTLFIRKDAFPNPVPDWLQSTFNLDWALNILYLENGKAAYLYEITAMYRMHQGGVTSSTYLPSIIHNGIALSKNLDHHFNYKYHHVFGKLQWRYKQLAVFFFEKKKYFKGIYWLSFCFFRNPASVITDTYFLKTLYKVTFTDHVV